MSVANRYKVLMLSGSQCFALLRAMANREAHLVDSIEAAETEKECLEVIGYMMGQLEDIRETRAIFNETPFQEGRPS